MFTRSLLATAAFAALLSAQAMAADYSTPTTACAPPDDYIVAPVVSQGFGAWMRRGDRPRIIYVEPYDPYHPPPVATPSNHTSPGPNYIAPQTAYIASSICDGFGYGGSQRSWYDGKLFYWPGGAGTHPDAFMIIERD